MGIPYGRQWIDEEDIKDVEKVLIGDWLTKGPQDEKYEEKIANYVEQNMQWLLTQELCIARSDVCSRSKEGDEIISSPITFVASTNAEYILAQTIFVDIDESTYCIDINKMKKKLLKNESYSSS